jgi:hypothetical protein
MKKTLKKINELLQEGIIETYAITGGMAHFYYIEPSVTYDLDLIVRIREEGTNLNPLTKIYRWAEKNSLSLRQEHIIIEGIPVQFLLEYNDLITEALNNADEIVLFEEKTYIMKPEYLMAIMLQTGRSSDKERFVKFLYESDYDKNRLMEILKRFNLVNNYNRLVTD